MSNLTCVPSLSCVLQTVIVILHGGFGQKKQINSMSHDSGLGSMQKYHDVIKIYM